MKISTTKRAKIVKLRNQIGKILVLKMLQEKKENAKKVVFCAENIRENLGQKSINVGLFLIPLCRI
jgi:hypothetical protein